MKQAYPGTQAVRRAVALLKAFTAGQPERGLADLSRSAGLNKTTTYRLLSALESEGLVERGADGECYRLGPEIVALGSRARGAGDVRAASREELLKLARSTRETVTLEILVGGDVLILDEHVGSHVVGTSLEVGTRWPAYATSTGKALLAHLSADERLAALPRSLTAFTPKTLTDRVALERELARVLARGCAVSAEELEPGFVAVGAPVWSSAGVVAAISVGGPRARLTAARVNDLMRLVPAAAARISSRLGGAPRLEGKRKENA
jgi:DNA-binding IclR family transcriptional regulator